MSANSKTPHTDTMRAYSHCMERCPSETIAGAGVEKAESLHGERVFRGTMLHPNDNRIPSEILEMQLVVARRLNDLSERNIRMAASIQANLENITKLRESHSKLQHEMDIYHFGEAALNEAGKGGQP